MGLPNQKRGLTMSRNVEEILQENGVDKVAFYYRGTPLINNAFTTCIFINTDKGRIEARGVSICSVKDVFCKKTGKQRAFGRAIRALVRKDNVGKINPSGRDLEVVKREYRCKSTDEREEFLNYKVPELTAINPDMELGMSDHENGKYISKFIFDLPMSYPMRVANQMYKYKSQYRPNPAGSQETKLLTKVERKPNLLIQVEPQHDPAA